MVLGAAVLVAVLVAAEPTIEGVPWWVSLFLLPVFGVLLEGLRRRMNRVDEATPRHRSTSEAAAEAATDPALPPPPVPPRTASADEKMLYVQMVIAEITASRDEARRELVQCEQKLAEANATIKRMSERQDQQDQYVARLQAMLDAFLPPGRPPTAMGPTVR